MEVKQKYCNFLASSKWGFSKKQLKEASKPLYGFRGRKIELIGSISLPVSSGSLFNACTEYITFNVVDMN
jgi:hypothetical protein